MGKSKAQDEHTSREEPEEQCAFNMFSVIGQPQADPSIQR